MSDEIQQALIALDDSDRATRINALHHLRAHPDEQIAHHLLPLLRDKDSAIRRLAAEIIGRSRHAPGVMALSGLLYDPHGHVRIAAADALGQINDSGAVPALIDALYDEQIDVRFAAANALGHIGDARAVFDLITILDSDDLPLAMMAAQALLNIGTPEALAAIQHLRQGDDYNFDIPPDFYRARPDDETVRRHPLLDSDAQTDDTIRRAPPE
jgi:HEAT repeat protein